MKSKLQSLLGLARVAKKIVYGTDAVCDKLQTHSIELIFVANDASVATINKIEKKGYFYNIPVNKSLTCEELNKSTGLINTKTLGITDKGFATSMLKEIQKLERESN